MLSFPNCKINLGLRILDKRPDGFHNLESVFLPIPLTDVLEISTSGALPSGTIRFQLHPEGEVPNLGDNICVKAYHAVKKRIPGLSGIDAFLLKTIPVGAGLGGGSSDGAFMIKLLNAKFKLNLTTEEMKETALELGSDCAFFIENTAALVTGRGENVEPLSTSIEGSYVVIVNPGIHINTGWAFQNLRRDSPTNTGIREIMRLPIAEWRDLLVNDFEPGIFQHYPEIGSIKKRLYEQNALYASMSGTGSSVYGIFPERPQLKDLFPLHYFVRTVKILPGT